MIWPVVWPERGEARKTAISAISSAVADFTPVKAEITKTPKSTGESQFTVKPTPDIAAALGARKRTDQVCIGFALESDENAEANAREKLRRKSLDAIVLNTVKSFGSDTGEYKFLSAGGEDFADWGTLRKSECAARILGHIDETLALVS